jgi:hypothetical protein
VISVAKRKRFLAAKKEIMVKKKIATRQANKI